jgi:hypothetical protein
LPVLRPFPLCPAVLARFVVRHRTRRRRHGSPGLRPPTHAVRRARLASDVLHDRNGALAYERDRAPGGTARRGTRRSERRGRRSRGQRRANCARPHPVCARTPTPVRPSSRSTHPCASLGELGSAHRCPPSRGCSMPSYDRALHALRTWLDSWSGIGHIVVGMARQGYDLQLTRYDEKGW